MIELPIENDLDVNGWDLTKALGLFRKSNPPLLEWLGSPIVYREVSSVPRRMRELAPTYYSPTACRFHYLHMAEGNYRSYLQDSNVSAKKYFYSLRPLLAMRWIERGLGVVPTEFQILVDKVIEEAEVRQAIALLIERKKAGAELDKGPRIETLSSFIASELSHQKSIMSSEKQDTPPIEELNSLFRLALKEVWADTF